MEEQLTLSSDNSKDTFTCRICGVSGLLRWVSEQPNDSDVCIICHEEGANK